MTEITAQIVANFRVYYPEFADDTAWTSTALTRYLQDGDQETGSKRWGGYGFDPANLKARGLFAYAAHKAVLGKARQRAVEAGMSPQALSRVNSKTVGDESVGYAVATPDAGQAQQIGDLDTTMYGQEFLRLRKRAGMGAATTGGIIR